MGAIKSQTSLKSVAKKKPQADETVKAIKRRETNRVEITIGGKKRTLVVGMRVSIYLTKLIPSGKAMDTFTRYLETMFLGLQREENDLPDDYNKDMVMDWIDDMDLAEWDDTKLFIDEAMGFIIQDYISSVEKLGGSLGNTEAPTEKEMEIYLRAMQEANKG